MKVKQGQIYLYGDWPTIDYIYNIIANETKFASYDKETKTLTKEWDYLTEYTLPKYVLLTDIFCEDI